jgi:ZIP family zinc transporter
VTTAVLFGLAAASALVIGALIGAWVDRPKRVVGVLLAFASGALFSALAFELFDEAIRLGGVARSSLGLLVGAAVFLAADGARPLREWRGGCALGEGAERRANCGWLGAARRGDARRRAGEPGTRRLARGERVARAIAGHVCLESSGGSRRLRRRAEGRPRQADGVATWTACATLLAAGVVAGTALAEHLSDEFVSLALSFAGGAVIASLADTLGPEAYELGGSPIAFATAVGFLVSFVLA